MVLSTALIQYSCLHGLLMLTCSTVYHVAKVIKYCAKYAIKSEPRSQPLKDVFSSIVKSLTEDSSSLKAVQKLLINSIDQDIVVLSLDGSRAVEEHLEDDQYHQHWTTTSLNQQLPRFSP